MLGDWTYLCDNATWLILCAVKHCASWVYLLVLGLNLRNKTLKIYTMTIMRYWLWKFPVYKR
jgi:hypothetical protein